ncbi:MAG: A/G-specific adenine glycosylase [Tenericutes bacterium HGW-Tenericutes-2]|jgi:A/G-specific adenine glycosylase|nr:MAG: A/G-specific adenine glycosylase [Tenericutes bacterium HGW-Tenericutes-2]
MDIKRLEAWYEKNHRKLIFRETNHPYYIWVSEIMLQQTQVEAVLPYFERHIKKYPTVKELALADEVVFQKDVEGLGYYRRFKNMLKAAKIIVDEYQGVFPNQYNDLIKLPGIGKYTAGAIMSISYNLPYSALDGNVIRVLSRYLGKEEDMRLEKNRKVLDSINQSFIENATPKIYTQAMMELGAKVCRPKNPKCEECPLSEHCFAYLNDQVEKFPVLSKLKDKKEFNYITLIIQYEDKYILRKRTESLLEGMYEYPQYEVESISNIVNDFEDQGIHVSYYQYQKSYRHIFTHQVWNMHIYKVIVKDKIMEDWILLDKEKISEMPMAIAHRKIKI